MNTLTNLIPTLYKSMDEVSREMVGMIPSVAKDSSGETAAINQIIRVPVVVPEAAVNITPGLYAPDNGDTTPSYVDMSISKQKMVPIRFNGDEMMALRSGGTLNPVVQNRFTQALRTLANEVEADLCSLHAKASRAYGTAGTTPFATTLSATAQMRKILVDNGAPTSNLRMVMDTTAGANLRSLAQLNKANEAGTDATLRNGELLNINGFSLRESAGIITSVAGTSASSTTNAAGYAVGATVITLASVGTGSLIAGDCITFAGDSNIYIVAIGDASAADGGTITLAAPGLKKAIATAATAITVVAASARNMAFDSNAIQLLTRAPAMPDGGDNADDVMNITDPVSGITFQVAVYRQYRQMKYEIGLAWGYQATKPEHIALLLG